jgi:hypothetical protein
VLSEVYVGLGGAFGIAGEEMKDTVAIDRREKRKPCISRVSHSTQENGELIATKTR